MAKLSEEIAAYRADAGTCWTNRTTSASAVIACVNEGTQTREPIRHVEDAARVAMRTLRSRAVPEIRKVGKGHVAVASVPRFRNSLMPVAELRVRRAAGHAEIEHRANTGLSELALTLLYDPDRGNQPNLGPDQFPALIDSKAPRTAVAIDASLAVQTCACPVSGPPKVISSGTSCSQPRWNMHLAHRSYPSFRLHDQRPDSLGSSSLPTSGGLPYYAQSLAGTFSGASP